MKKLLLIILLLFVTSFCYAEVYKYEETDAGKVLNNVEGKQIKVVSKTSALIYVKEYKDNIAVTFKEYKETVYVNGKAISEVSFGKGYYVRYKQGNYFLYSENSKNKFLTSYKGLKLSSVKTCLKYLLSNETLIFRKNKKGFIDSIHIKKPPKKYIVLDIKVDLPYLLKMFLEKENLKAKKSYDKVERLPIGDYGKIYSKTKRSVMKDSILITGRFKVDKLKIAKTIKNDKIYINGKKKYKSGKLKVGKVLISKYLELHYKHKGKVKKFFTINSTRKMKIMRIW